MNTIKNVAISISLLCIQACSHVIACAALLMLGACSEGNDNGAISSVVPQEHAVGMTSMTFVDTSRPTAAHGAVPAVPTRTIETTIIYPAEGIPGSAATADAPVDGSAAPYPLVVLSHGFTAPVELYVPLAKAWASRGYVVALPRFPLTSFGTPGPVAQDIQNQPADVSFVIDEMIAESETSGSFLSHAIDGDEIAVSGNSGGGITTYGLVANSCCRDPRIDAAIVLSGATRPYAGGEYDLSDTPPILVLHGVNDIQLNYNQAVREYNQLQPPKGFLSLEESGHISYFIPSNPDQAFDVVAQATADFLDGELRGDTAALERLPEDQMPGVATMYWAPDEASNVPVQALPEPETNRQAFVSADSNLTDGQVITVTWSGFLPGKDAYVLQCPMDSAATCKLSGGYPTDKEGMGSVEELVIHTGPIGSGVCDSANPCQIVVNDNGGGDEAVTVRIPITFAN